MFVDSTGIHIPTVEEILERISTDQRAEIDPALSTDPDSLVGQFNGIVASHEREAFEANRAAFHAFDRSQAEEPILDAVCALTGTLRNAATKTKFRGSRRVSVNMNNGASVQAGVFKVSVTGHADRVFDLVDSPGMVAGVFTNTSGITQSFLLNFESVDTGPIDAPAGTLETIVTPTSGINSVTNPTDPVLGKLRETDEALRQRAEKEVRQGGSCTNAALVADLLAFEDEDGANPIVSVTILENLTNATDTNGLPPHSFEAIVWDGVLAPVTDDEIGAVIAANKPLGIETWGLDAASDGTRFTRAVQTAFELELTVEKDFSVYIGTPALIERMVAFALANQTPGGRIEWSDYVGVAMNAPGIMRVTLARLRLSGSATWLSFTDITIPIRKVATLVNGDVSILNA